MIQFNIKRDEILKPLQIVSHVAERRQTVPILSHVFLSVENGCITLRGTDLEILIEARANLSQMSTANGQITLPARKLLDICRNLPEDANLEFIEVDNRCLIHSGGSQFSLATLPVEDFPAFDQSVDSSEEVLISSQYLLNLIQATAFAIAQKDVRYYLNGMLLEAAQNHITFVATDGHRLALNRLEKAINLKKNISIILPRKSVIELTRLLSNQPEDTEVKIFLSENGLRVSGSDFNFVSRLIEGQFPAYDQVIPKDGNKIFNIDRSRLKQALVRTSILSNERLPGVRMELKKDRLCLLAKNHEKEEAKEEVEVNYMHEEITIGFNASYLVDVLNALHSDEVKLTLFNPNTAFVVEEENLQEGRTSLFVIMPMRL